MQIVPYPENFIWFKKTAKYHSGLTNLLGTRYFCYHPVGPQMALDASKCPMANIGVGGRITIWGFSHKVQRSQELLIAISDIVAYKVFSNFLRPIVTCCTVLTI